MDFSQSEIEINAVGISWVIHFKENIYFAILFGMGFFLNSFFFLNKVTYVILGDFFLISFH